MDEDDQVAAEAYQNELEGRRFQQEQMRRESQAFDKLMRRLWGALQTQWRTETWPK